MIPLLALAGSAAGQWRLLGAGLACAGLFAAGAYVGQHWARADLLAEQRDRSADATRSALAALQQSEAGYRHYQQALASSNARAIVVEAERNTLARALERQRKAYDALPKSAVPADCKLSPERLQHIQSSFDAAFGNTLAGKLQPALPGAGAAAGGRP